jgi:Holliday junction resolvasome RuvABC endonuclease subunit
MKDLIILANDPSFTAWGWVVLNAKGKILDQGCIKTVPTAKKLKMRKGDDRVRRISEINQALLQVIDKYKVNYMVAELPHGSQNAQAAIMIGATAAIIQTLADVMELPVEWYSEADAKKCALGKNTASKDEMINRMNEIYDVDYTGTKYKDEAVADALAIHYAASKSSATLKLYKG